MSFGFMDVLRATPRLFFVPDLSSSTVRVLGLAFAGSEVCRFNMAALRSGLERGEGLLSSLSRRSGLAGGVLYWKSAVDWGYWNSALDGGVLLYRDDSLTFETRVGLIGGRRPMSRLGLETGVLHWESLALLGERETPSVLEREALRLGLFGMDRVARERTGLETGLLYEKDAFIDIVSRLLIPCFFPGTMDFNELLFVSCTRLRKGGTGFFRWIPIDPRELLFFIVTPL